MRTEEMKMIDELLGNDNDKLNDWEIGFLESLKNENRDVLTEKQFMKLETIWMRVFK